MAVRFFHQVHQHVSSDPRKQSTRFGPDSTRVFTLHSEEKSLRNRKPPNSRRHPTGVYLGEFTNALQRHNKRSFDSTVSDTTIQQQSSSKRRRLLHTRNLSEGWQQMVKPNQFPIGPVPAIPANLFGTGHVAATASRTTDAALSQTAAPAVPIPTMTVRASSEQDQQQMIKPKQFPIGPVPALPANLFETEPPRLISTRSSDNGDGTETTVQEDTVASGPASDPSQEDSRSDNVGFGMPGDTEDNDMDEATQSLDDVAFENSTDDNVMDPSRFATDPIPDEINILLAASQTQPEPTSNDLVRNPGASSIIDTPASTGTINLTGLPDRPTPPVPSRSDNMDQIPDTVTPPPASSMTNIPASSHNTNNIQARDNNDDVVSEEPIIQRRRSPRLAPAQQLRRSPRLATKPAVCYKRFYRLRP